MSNTKINPKTIDGLGWYMQEYSDVLPNGTPYEEIGYHVYAVLTDGSEVVISDMQENAKDVMSSIYFWAEENGVPDEKIEAIFEKQRIENEKNNPIPPGHGYEVDEEFDEDGNVIW